MNRRKKIKEILTKKAKKSNAKLQPNTKPRYISKAEWAKLEAEEAAQVVEGEGETGPVAG